MKFYVTALLALMLSACSSFNPVKSVVITTVEVGAQVTEYPQVAASDMAVETTAPTAAVNVLPLPEPEPIATVPLIDERDLQCLTRNAYFEARGEGVHGIAAVTHVVMNRAKSGRFPDSVCGVVYQGKHVNGKPVRFRCQFTWYCDGKADKITDWKAYKFIEETIVKVLTGEIRNPVGSALYYHEKSIRWRYAASFRRVSRVNNHVFYSLRL